MVWIKLNKASLQVAILKKYRLYLGIGAIAKYKFAPEQDGFLGLSLRIKKCSSVWKNFSNIRQFAG